MKHRSCLISVGTPMGWEMAIIRITLPESGMLTRAVAAIRVNADPVELDPVILTVSGRSTNNPRCVHQKLTHYSMHRCSDPRRSQSNQSVLLYA